MAFSFENKKAKTVTKLMPVLISYKQPMPPDSIQDFIKIYMQTKKLEIINAGGYMELFKESFSANMMDAINSGKLNSETAKDLPYLPVCNSLFLRIFSDTIQVANKYVIDSIKWAVKLLPSKDTSILWKSYFPLGDDAENPFFQLKSFVDIVLSSKQLK